MNRTPTIVIARSEQACPSESRGSNLGNNDKDRGFLDENI